MSEQRRAHGSQTTDARYQAAATAAAECGGPKPHPARSGAARYCCPPYAALRERCSPKVTTAGRRLAAGRSGGSLPQVDPLAVWAAARTAASSGSWRPSSCWWRAAW